MSANPTPGDARSYRLTSIDMLRGLVIIIMALDHVRDFFLQGAIQDPMTQPDVGLGVYLTRWITHLCAPVFVFLAGTSAGLMATRKPRAELGAFLAKRGVWLIFVEFAVISTCWTLSPLSGVEEMGGHIVLVAQVIWAIGASMLVLAAAQFLGTGFCAVVGALIVLGHNGLDPIWPAAAMEGADPLWYALHTQTNTVIGPFLLFSGYPLLPWIGVMLLGFGTAGIFRLPGEARDTLLLRAGITMMIAFFVLRALQLYGDPNPWISHTGDGLATAMDFMNVTKYPPSLLFLLITLGPMAIVCAYAERWQGWVKDCLVMFGRVPFFFYIAHWYLIRALGLGLAQWQGIELDAMITFFFFFPEAFGLSLLGVYGVWALVVALLYPACRWFAGIKQRSRAWWLSYL